MVVLAIASGVHSAPPMDTITTTTPSSIPTTIPQLLINGVPQSYDNFTGPIPIISQSDYEGPDGSFNYSFVTANGINQNSNGYIKKIFLPTYDANGTLTNETHEEDILVQHGSYSYFSPDGQYVNVYYIADENGFQAFGDNLPTPPAVPADIMASLKAQADKNAQLNVEPIPNGSQIVSVPSTVALQAPKKEVAPIKSEATTILSTSTTLTTSTTPKSEATTKVESFGITTVAAGDH